MVEWFTAAEYSLIMCKAQLKTQILIQSSGVYIAAISNCEHLNCNVILPVQNL